MKASPLTSPLCIQMPEQFIQNSVKVIICIRHPENVLSRSVLQSNALHHIFQERSNIINSVITLQLQLCHHLHYFFSYLHAGRIERNKNIQQNFSYSCSLVLRSADFRSCAGRRKMVERYGHYFYIHCTKGQE